MKTEITVQEGVSKRLDFFLSEQFSDISRTRIQNLIKSGAVLVNGGQKPSRYLISDGDHISIEFLDSTSPREEIVPKNIKLNIVYEDENVILINKQAGITVHPGAGTTQNTLVNGLAYHFKELSDINGIDRPGIVHRLDKDTSGIMIIAKNNSTHSFLGEQFEKKTVEKIYMGITWGVWDVEEGKIEGNISRKVKDPTAYILTDSGRYSYSGYKVISQGKYISAVEFYPKTGRTHQIRVHSASMNHPIFADEKYGGGKSRTRGFLPEISRELVTELKALGRHALHARSLSLMIPGKKERQTFSADLPYDMKSLFSKIPLL